MKAHGKKALAWHDVLSVPQSCINIDQDIIIDFWNADPTAEALPGGWLVLNSNRWQTYYILGGSKTSVTKILNWNPAIFAGATAVDGLISIFWRTLKRSTLPSEWIIVNLGSSQSISQVTLKWHTVFASNYTIQVSPDNTTWTTVYTVTGENGAVDIITFSATSSRYVRMDSTAWSNNTERVYLQEIEIYH